LVEADVTEGDIFGVKPKPFIEGLCKYIVEQDLRTLGGSADFDVIVRQLKLNIYREAKSRSRDKKKPDYRAAFDIFDADRSGTISLPEFRSYLEHLHLVPNLSGTQIDAIMSLFDKKKKKCIDFEDFQAFAEEAEVTAKADDAMGGDAMSIIASSSGGGGGKEVAWANLNPDQLDELLDVDEEEAALLNGKPPISVTKNADCDWLAWHLFRQSYQIEPMDTEGVLTELESYCSEAEMTQNQPGVSVKEFWNLLSEFKMVGSMSKSQFIKGIQLVSEAGNGRDEDRVDYAALVKVAVRMGRAFNAQLQEREKEVDKQFAPLLADMKKFFKGLCDERVDPNDPIPRYEKVFRRLDSDQDGMLTPKEFRVGLLRLQFKDFKLWTNRMVKRLFDECDRNRDGFLSIQEFSLYILEKRSLNIVTGVGGTGASSSGKQGYLSRSREFSRSEHLEDVLRDGRSSSSRLSGAGRSSLDLSDPENEDDEFFRRPRSINEHQLTKKITDTLMETVPNDSGNPAKHFDEMRLSVRRFFQRSDPDFKGVASEERFRAFLRRSGLQEALTAAELRRLTDKLKKKGTGRDRYETFIDYEKLCQSFVASTESTPRSKGEIIFYRFQEAAMTAAAQNRSFLSLCSLSDPRLTGKISKDELGHIAKMMDCPLTRAELETMLEVSTQGIVNRDDSIDYRGLQNMLETYPGRDMLQPPSLAGLTLNTSQSYGTLPSNASPHKTIPYGTAGLNNPLMQTINGRTSLNQSVTTPLGYTISTPYRADGAGALATNTPYAQNSLYQQSSGSFEKIARSVMDRMRVQANLDSHTLRKRFESFDNNNSGQVHTRALVSVLEEYGQVLSTSELHSLMSLYGRMDDDLFFYDAFVRAIEASPSQFPRGSQSGPLSGMSVDQPAYITPRVLQRYRELRQEGRGLRDLCEVHDLDHTGQIPTLKFRDLLTRTQLLQTQHQLSKVLEDFAVVGQENYLSYDDFCHSLERASRDINNGSNNYYSGIYNSSSNREGRMTPRTNRGNQNQHLLGIAADNASDGPYFSTEEDDFHEGFGSATGVRHSQQRFRQSTSELPPSNGNAAARRYQSQSSQFGTIELERGSVDYGMMSPPKVSDSYSGNYLAPSSARSSYSQGGGGSSMRYSTPTRSSRDGSNSSFNAPRTSPSKMGSKIWGSQTPLAKKGAVPQMHNRWCCAVCLYTENPAEVENCTVCDSPNYAQRKDYQLKEQCRNCTFLNGEFAEECEMCGEPLHSSKRH
jgi:Ca2+-binding EF-hand superfamily protein